MARATSFEELCEDYGWTYRQLADKEEGAGVSRSTLYGFSEPGRAPVQVTTILAIAYAMGLHRDEVEEAISESRRRAEAGEE